MGKCDNFVFSGMGKKKKDEPDDRGPTSLFLFTPTSPVRKLMTWLVSKKASQSFVNVKKIALN